MSAILPLIERLSPRVVRVLGCNAHAMTLQGTNTYLVGTGRRRILVDTGDQGVARYLETLSRALCEDCVEIGEIVITHWHGDHVGGITGVCAHVMENVPTISKMRADHKEDVPQVPGWSGYNYVLDGARFKTDGATLRAVHTPGHTTDHMSLILEEENAVFSGDCILGEGTAMFEDLHTYMCSLERLRALRPAHIYPGHGPVITDGLAVIDGYVRHRNTREAQIVAAFGDHAEWTAAGLVERIYVGLANALVPVAEVNVRHHLSKLVKDGVVEMADDGEVWVIRHAPSKI